MGSFVYPFILLAGVLQAVQAPMNQRVREAVGNPFLAGVVLFLVVLASWTVLFILVPRPLPTAASVSAMPWWAPLGSLLGTLAVYGMLTMTSQVGAGTFNGLLVTAGIVTSLLLDHFGWIGLPVHALNAWRILGGALMVGGIALIAAF